MARKTTVGVVLVLSLGILAILFLQTKEVPPTYTVREIEAFKSAARKTRLTPFINGINNEGQIIGNFAGINQIRGFFWDSKDGVRFPMEPQFPKSFFCAINDSGMVVGSATLPSGSNVAILWDERSGTQELGFDALSPYISWDINSNGEVLLGAKKGNETICGIWSAGSIIRSVTFASPLEVRAGGLTESGTVVFSIYESATGNRIYNWFPNSQPQLCLYSTGPHQSGRIPISGDHRIPLTRRLTSERDLILNRWSPTEAYVLSASGTFHEFSNSAHTHTSASDINNRNRVIGSIFSLSQTNIWALQSLEMADGLFGSDLHGKYWYDHHALQCRAVIWDETARIDLNELIDDNEVYLRTALAINDEGEIVCEGTRDRQGGYYLLQPNLKEK